jgi:hypothetical protein
MKTMTSHYVNTLTQIIKDIPPTKQWVIFTPTFSISSWITKDKELSSQKFEIISGAHTNRFSNALEQFNNHLLNGLIISYEQTLNPSKFNQILDTIKGIDVLILDQVHRFHLHSLYYSIEMEVMAKQISIMQPKEIHQIVAANQAPLSIKESIIHPLNHPTQVLSFPFNLQALLTHISTYKRVLWIAQSYSEANAVSAYLSFANISHALIHKKVEESLKVSLQEKFIHHELHSCVTTLETQLPLDIQGIDCVVYTFDVRSDQVLSFFVPYINENASWIMIDWFKASDLRFLGHPINQNMYDFLHHVSMIEDGCSMREAERTLNIDSYEFERIIKFLKGRSIIKKIGLKYVIDLADAINALYEEDSESFVAKRNFNVIKKQYPLESLPKGVIFPISAKKIMPVGFYDFTIIPDDLKHEDGFIFASTPDISTIQNFVEHHHIECIIDATVLEKGSNESEWLKSSGIKVLPIISKKVMSSFEAKNPYQRVKLAKSMVDHIAFPDLTNVKDVLIVIKNYDEGWLLSSLCIALKDHAPHVVIYPICLMF